MVHMSVVMECCMGGGGGGYGRGFPAICLLHCLPPCSQKKHEDGKHNCSSRLWVQKCHVIRKIRHRLLGVHTALRLYGTPSPKFPNDWKDDRGVIGVVKRRWGHQKGPRLSGGGDVVAQMSHSLSFNSP